jgi:hypothetical protein
MNAILALGKRFHYPRTMSTLLRRSLLSGIIWCSGLFSAVCGSDLRVEPSPAPLHQSTEWEVRTSIRFDSLCLLNALSGDPFYLAHYHKEYDHFNPLFTPAEQAAFRALKRIIKDESGGIISAKLTLMFSTLEEGTLDALIDSVHDGARLHAAWRQTIYWGPHDWAVYTGSVRPNLETALRALKRVGFETYWEENARPRVEKRIAELKLALPQYNIVPAIESRLGKVLPSNTITLYLVAYSEPHGIRITGARFITHYSYPFTTVLRNAVHEMLHPPYDARSPAVSQALRRIEADSRLRGILETHNKSYGYNDMRSYVEEDSVQALEAVINEQFGFGRNPQEYWKTQDGGMHILAVAIYTQLKQAEREHAAWKSYPDFFCAAVKRGDLTEDNLARTLDRFWPGGQ